MLLINIQIYGTQSIKYIYKTEQLQKQFFALTSAQMQMYLLSCLKTSKSKRQACLSSIAKDQQICFTCSAFSLKTTTFTPHINNLI